MSLSLSSGRFPRLSAKSSKTHQTGRWLLTMSSDEDDPLIGDMFQEPEGYREAERAATYTEYIMLSGQSLRLRLVGHNPLWVP